MHVRFVLKKMVVGQVYLRLLHLSLINIISLIFHAFRINITVTRRTGRRSLGTLEENVLSEVWKDGRVRYFHIVFRLLGLILTF